MLRFGWLADADCIGLKRSIFIFIFIFEQQVTDPLTRAR
jgi:hypothetical protein